MPRDKKTIYLTFDDGPIPEVTSWVLDQLRAFDAKGTFFCVGDNIQKYPEIAKEVLARGHQLGNHTMHHLKGWATPLPKYLEDVAHCHSHLSLWSQSTLFRPPYGRITKAQGRALLPQYKIIMWEILTHDYDARIDPKQSLQKAIKYTQAGSIVVFHDSLKAKQNMYYILPRFLEHFSKMGFAFDVL